MLICRKEENANQEKLEKEREEDIRVWVDPQRRSIYSIKWSTGKIIIITLIITADDVCV